MQWYRNGDHPNDNCKSIEPSRGGKPFLSEGQIVRYFRHPSIEGSVVCKFCSCTMHDHGFIDSGDSGWTVCPGDYIVQTDAPQLTINEYFPTKALSLITAGNTINNNDISYLSKIGKVSTTLTMTPRRLNETLH